MLRAIFGAEVCIVHSSWMFNCLLLCCIFVELAACELAVVVWNVLKIIAGVVIFEYVVCLGGIALASQAIPPIPTVLHSMVCLSVTCLYFTFMHPA